MVREPDSVEELEAWHKRVSEMPGFLRSRHLADFAQTTRFVGATAAEFENHLAQADSNETVLILAKDNFRSPELAEFEAITHRRLFTVVSALYSRIDYLRRWRKRVGWEKGTAGDEAFQGLLAELLMDGAHSWVMDLRRTLIHRALPETDTRLAWDRTNEDGFRFSTFIRTDWLLEEHAHSWSAKAREFMRETGPELDYRKIITTYVDRVFLR